MERIGLIAGMAIRPAEQGAQPLAAPAGATVPRPVSGPAPAGGADATRLSAYSRLWQQKDQAIGEMQAAAVRQRAFSEADRLVSEMRQRIEGLTKNYPPFPPGSEERISYLRAISALRQQLEALTIPPEVDRAGSLPEPPPLPSATAADVEWLAYAEDLAIHGKTLDSLRSVEVETIPRTPMWPEIGGATEPVADAGLDTLRRVIDGLLTTSVPLSRQGNLQDAGLI